MYCNSLRIIFEWCRPTKYCISKYGNPEADVESSGKFGSMTLLLCCCLLHNAQCDPQDVNLPWDWAATGPHGLPSLVFAGGNHTQNDLHQHYAPGTTLSIMDPFMVKAYQLRTWRIVAKEYAQHAWNCMKLFEMSPVDRWSSFPRQVMKWRNNEKRWPERFVKRCLCGFLCTWRLCWEGREQITR